MLRIYFGQYAIYMVTILAYYLVFPTSPYLMIFWFLFQTSIEAIQFVNK